MAYVFYNPNPQGHRVDDYQVINQYGGDPQTAFYKYAEANGIDPNEILNMLK